MKFESDRFVRKIMRDPSQAMLDAGEDVIENDDMWTPACVFKAMIEAAKKEVENENL